ncbi:MAG TPA: membrane dipeptidase [Gemmatimonadales bacterium]|nr:membrane dipeptidase [Gemmatimonadales bacterium]
MSADPALIARLHRDAPLTDVHVHPSLKAYLFRRNLWRHYTSGKTFNPFSSRSDFPTLERGGVGVIWAAHHLPEAELFRQCFILRAAAWLLVPVYRKITSGSRLGRVLEMIDALEREIARRPDRVAVARSAADVPRIRAEGKIAVVHAVEGAHVLEGRIESLDELARRGVALVTLSHFFDNGLAAQTPGGIPRDFFIRKLCPFHFRWSQPAALTPFGRDVLRRMTELRMLVDVTHCTPEARAAVFGELNPSRPVVATHVGLQRYNPDPYCLADDELREIARRGGFVGVIFMTYWLRQPHPPDAGLDLIWRTVEHIHAVTGSFDHIALGTDFDGFTDPPDDVRDAGMLPAVTAMLLDRGMAPADVSKVLGQNARRVLDAGWR